MFVDCRADLLKPVELHRCSSWTRLTCPLLYYDRCVGLTVQKTVEIPKWQLVDYLDGSWAFLGENIVTSGLRPHGVWRFEC